MKIKFGIAVLALSLCEVAKAANWIPIGTTNQFSASIDISSVAQSGGYRKAWFLYDYETAQTSAANGKAYQSTLLMNYFDCKAKTVFMKQYHHYSGASKEGSIVQSSDAPISPGAFQDIVPDSVAETGFEIVCKGIKR